jgi:1,4-alpha-glucan branching enzyme
MLHVHVIDELRTGGAQTHLVTMLRESVKYHGIEHHVMTLFGDGELSQEIRDLGIQVHVLDLRPYFRGRKFLAAVSDVQMLLESLRPDLVEAHLTWSRFIALFAAWRVGVPLRVGFEHGDLYMSSWKVRAANFFAQSFMHHIVVCSEALGDWFRRTHGISRSKLLVLHNCVDLTRFNKRGPKAQGIEFPQGTIVFCAVGTLGGGVNKRVDVCIRALASARSSGAKAALVICGDGEQRSALEDLAHSLSIASHVKFLGTCADVASVLRACHVLCHAAPFEPFGIVVIEAMAVGLPIVVPNSGGVRETVEHRVNGLFYPALNDQALGDAMVTLANDPALRESMGLASRQIAEERFSVQEYLSKLYQAYGVDVTHSTVTSVGARA